MFAWLAHLCIGFYLVGIYRHSIQYCSISYNAKDSRSRVGDSVLAGLWHGVCFTGVAVSSSNAARCSGIVWAVDDHHPYPAGANDEIISNRR